MEKTACPKNPEGTEPTKLLLLKYKKSRLINCVKAVGIVPDSWLLPKLKYVKAVFMAESYVSPATGKRWPFTVQHALN